MDCVRCLTEAGFDRVARDTPSVVMMGEVDADVAYDLSTDWFGLIDRLLLERGIETVTAPGRDRGGESNAGVPGGGRFRSESATNDTR